MTRGAAGSRIAVLHGGRSSEREVSLVTGHAVLEALRDASLGDRAPSEVLGVEVLGDGRWRVATTEASPADALAALAEVDVFFLALHGGDGEDGTIQGFLRHGGHRHTGSGVAASSLCMDKWFARELLCAGGVRIAPAELVDRRAWLADPRGALERCGRVGERGWVAKPRRGGSSVGVAVGAGCEELGAAIERILVAGDDALVEARLVGTELTCGVLGNRNEDLVALPPVEIVPAAGHFFDYEEKYSESGARELCPPVSFGDDVCERAEELARAAHRTLRCDGYSRTDFVLVEGEGEPTFLEVNTLPGLTPRSLLPQEAAAVGMDFGALCLAIVDASFRAIPERP